MGQTDRQTMDGPDRCITLAAMDVVSVSSGNVRLSTIDSRTFLVLLTHVTSAPSLAIFRQRLKTFLFSLSYPEIVI